MPRHATERSLSVNALKKRSAGKSILVEMSQLAWDLDPYAKRRVQAILRRCGRGQDTDLRILSDGEDGLRGGGGNWFGKKCQHRLDWFHVARRIARIEKEFLYLPYGDDFQERLAAHWANLNSMKWMLWNDGVEMAEFGMTRVRIGLFQHDLAHPEVNSERFESIEAKLDELRSYLYANRESVRGYAEAYRNGERISTAHVESTVNQLINWRMCNLPKLVEALALKVPALPKCRYIPSICSDCSGDGKRSSKLPKTYGRIK